MASNATRLSLAHEGHKSWTEASSAYGTTVASTTALAAVEQISLTNERLSMSSSTVKAIDLGAGTGSVTLEISRRFPQLLVTATDISKGMLTQLRKALNAQRVDMAGRIENAEEMGAEGKDNVSTQVFDVCAAELADSGPLTQPATYTHVVSAYLLQVVLDPWQAVRNMYRLLREDGESRHDRVRGVAAVAIWDFSRRCDPHTIWERAATRVNPAYRAPPRNITNEVMTMEDVETIMQDVGFVDVSGVVRSYKFSGDIMHFYWESGNPMAVERIQSFEGYGNLADVKAEMRELVELDFGNGDNLYVDLAFVTGIKTNEK